MRKKDNPVRGKMMQFNLVELEELKKEVGQGETEPRPNKMHKENGLVERRRRNLMFTWQFKTRKILLLEKPVCNK